MDGSIGIAPYKLNRTPIENVRWVIKMKEKRKREFILVGKHTTFISCSKIAILVLRRADPIKVV